MLLNLPCLLPNQTLYSWCGLVHAWNGLSPVETSLRLFGSKHAALIHDFPSHLAGLQRSTRGCLGLTRTLALEHTLLGYFLPLAGTELVSTILSRTFHDAMPELKMVLGITASRIGGRHPLKGCTTCFQEDEKSCGTAYWHLDHQYPSVAVCRRHRCPLSLVWDTVTPVHRRGWLLPAGGLNKQWIGYPNLEPVQIDRLLRLAEFSEHFSRRSPGSLDSAVLAATYQTALQAQGLATVRGSLRLAALVKATRSHYKGIETVPGFEALQAVTQDWPGLAAVLARRKPRPGHPLKHLLLISMLFDTWRDFEASYDASRLQGPCDIGPGPPVIDHASEDFCDFVTEGHSIRSASRMVGISVTTGVTWANRSGLPYTPRTKSFSACKKTSATKLLRHGVDVAVAAMEVGISRISISRLLSSDYELKEAWKLSRFFKARKQARTCFIRLLQQNPMAQMKQVQRLSGSPYMWLYRNDREWLRESIPSLWKDSKRHKNHGTTT